MPEAYQPDAEVVELCRDLIRIDTSNYGPDPGPGERVAAEHVAGLLDEVGISSQLFEAAPGRASLVAHWEPEGTDGSSAPCSSTGTSMWFRRTPTTGRSHRSPGRSSTAACGGGVPST